MVRILVCLALFDAHARAKKDMRLMHPLSRVNEISTDVDDTPHTLYFDQMKHGIYMRMAWLALVWAQSSRARVLSNFQFARS